MVERVLSATYCKLQHFVAAESVRAKASIAVFLRSMYFLLVFGNAVPLLPENLNFDLAAGKLNLS